MFTINCSSNLNLFTVFTLLPQPTRLYPLPKAIHLDLQIAKMGVGILLKVLGGETKMTTQDYNLFLPQM